MNKEEWASERGTLLSLYQEETGTLESIGVRYNVTRERVRQVMVELDIPRRRVGNREGSKLQRPPRFQNLEEYLQSGGRTSSRESPIILRRFLFPSLCIECGSKRHLHLHHIRYPAIKEDDIQVLCASCHCVKHRKGMTYAKQLELYCQQEEGASCKELSEQYHISKSLVYFILQKIRKGREILRGS